MSSRLVIGQVSATSALRASMLAGDGRGSSGVKLIQPPRLLVMRTSGLRDRPWSSWASAACLCVARIRGAGALTPAPSRLGDADIVRASEFQHAVENIDRHVHLGGPTLIGVRAQPVPDHALEPADGGLGPGARIVARGL